MQSKATAILVPIVAMAALLVVGAESAAQQPRVSGGWEMTPLNLKVKAKNTTSAYSMPDKKAVDTILLYTTDKKVPGAAFRCEKGRLFAILSMRKSDLGKALRDGVRRPRDWPLTVTIGDAPPVTEAWVSMQNGRLVMAHSAETTRALYAAARRGDVVAVKRKEGQDAVVVQMPAADSALFDDYLSACSLNPEYLSGD